MTDGINNPYVYPCKTYCNKERLPGIESKDPVHHPGMTLLDFFAGQFIAAGETPYEAFRLAALALKEREAYL